MNIPGYDAWRLRGPEEHLGVMMEACETCKGIGSDTKILLPAKSVDLLAGKHEAIHIAQNTQAAFWLHGRDNATALFLMHAIHKDFAAMAEALGYTITRKPIACEECDGTGEVEVTLDEPDGDYEYERRRDAQMEAAK